MVFQPVSPIRDFQRRLSRDNRGKRVATSQQSEGLSLEKHAQTSQKLRKKSGPSKQMAEAQLERSGSSVAPSNNDLVEAGHLQRSTQGGSIISTSEPQARVAVQQDDQTAKHDSTSGTSMSDMMDFAQAINLPETAQRKSVRLSQSPKSPKTPSRPISTAGQSFFEDDSDSDGNEPVFGRADSVRVTRPSIIQHSPSRRVRLSEGHDSRIGEGSRPVSPLTVHIGDISGSIMASNDAAEHTINTEGPSEALRKLEGAERDDTASSAYLSDNIQYGQQANKAKKPTAEKEALSKSPVADKERLDDFPASSAPLAPAKYPSQRRVKIRPSDLVVYHPKEGTRNFRETVVATPYPVLEEEKDSSDASEKETKQEDKILPRRTNTFRSTRFENDRFPSIDQGEVLFLDLGIAQHPGATITLEIRIADKSMYDDEMLFHQVRKVYQHHLLGVSRRPFSLIRSVTHATVSTAVQHDFKVAEFMKHFRHPHLGRKRKTWIIWLRYHSQDRPRGDGDPLNIVKCPLSASLRSADKRLSMQSDSTSTLNFPFLPILSIPRLPFFNREISAPSSASTYRESQADCADNGGGVVKIELHHEFSFWTLAFLFFWVIFFSVAAVILWIIFGVPGARPGDETGKMVSTLSDRLSWSMAAQTRVLTGLVLGLMVALLGSMFELCLVAGAYVLL